MTEVAAAIWPAPPTRGPFSLDDGDAYRRWRDARMAAHPRTAADLIVELNDPLAPTAAEQARLVELCGRCNMAVFAGRPVTDGTQALMRAFGRRFGLERLDHNALADDDGITPIAVAGEGTRTRYIPYTDKPLSWHTDGYYNSPETAVLGLLLYLVSDAAEGGENALLDHEMAYIALREANPDHVAAFMRPTAFTIPPNEDGDMPSRAARTGPVFTVHPGTGALVMRYSARTRNIVWEDRADVTAARQALTTLLDDAACPWILRHRLAPGQGLLCNNVLHNRTRFRDGEGHTRLMYRARYHDRIAGTIPHSQGSDKP